MRVLLTKFDDGDARDAKLRSATGPGKYDEHQDDAYVLLRERTTPVLIRSPAQPIQIVVDLASAEAAAHAFGATEAYGDFRQLVRSDNVDIVTVCVRVPSHLEVVMAALEAGKHVMCEWPLGRNLEEAENMAEAFPALARRT